MDFQKSIDYIGSFRHIYYEYIPLSRICFLSLPFPIANYPIFSKEICLTRSSMLPFSPLSYKICFSFILEIYFLILGNPEIILPFMPIYVAWKRRRRVWLS